jgi:hypothetical protein
MMFNNLLRQAFKLIPQQDFQYCKWESKTVNEQGIMINSYASPVSYKGSIQAIDQALYEKLGLDFEKQYRMVYASVFMHGVDVSSEQNTPDRLIFEGKNWKVIRNTPWYSADGWCGVLVVEDTENL